MSPKERREAYKKKPQVPPDLTGASAAILKWILECWLSGFLPSVREIADAFGYKSTNAVQTHLKRLKEAGMLADRHGKPLELTDEAMALTGR